MKEFWNGIQLVFAVIGGWLGWFLGECDGLMYALIAFVIADYVTGVMCAVSMFLALDYEHHAILIGYFFYLFYGSTAIALPFCYASMYTEPWSLMGFGLTLTYNGKRGKQSKMLSYWFYPVHLLILGALRLYLGI